MHLRFLENIIDEPSQGHKLPEFGDAQIDDEQLFVESPRKSNSSSKKERGFNTPTQNQLADQETYYKTPANKMAEYYESRDVFDEPE